MSLCDFGDSTVFKKYRVQKSNARKMSKSVSLSNSAKIKLTTLSVN